LGVLVEFDQAHQPNNPYDSSSSPSNARRLAYFFDLLCAVESHVLVAVNLITDPPDVQDKGDGSNEIEPKIELKGFRSE
jgi:hypothetical protein